MGESPETLVTLAEQRDMTYHCASDVSLFFKPFGNKPGQRFTLGMTAFLPVCTFVTTPQPGFVKSDFLDHIHLLPSEREHQLKGKGLLAVDHWMGGNMCHTLFDHFYRVWMADQLGIDYEHAIFFASTWKWTRFILEKILMPGRSIIYIEPGIKYRLETLYFAANSFPRDESLPQSRELKHPANFGDCLFLQDIRASIRNFVDNHSCDTGKAPRSEKLFISRQAGATRPIANLQAVEQLFRRMGFDVHLMEKLSPLEQLELMRGRSHIAGFHGAGLSNIISADQDTKILELFPNGGQYTYQQLFKSLGHSCHSFKNHRPGEPPDQDERPRVRIEKLRRNLLRFLSD